ncbi:hypothetical protein N665_0660s0004 [Sinapis alba]|nr:hypothetical protein N665_0660s0004 [Sinapis alba]
MVETLFSFGVEKLWDLIVRESERLKGADEQYTELKSEINMLRCFLKDADAKKHRNAMVRNCLEEIKEIVYDAEDIIETFLIKEELGKASGIRKRMRRVLAFIIRISKVILSMQSFGLQQSISGDCYSQPLQERREMRKTFSNDNEGNLVGLEQNVKTLVGYLV